MMTVSPPHASWGWPSVIVASRTPGFLSCTTIAIVPFGVLHSPTPLHVLGLGHCSHTVAAAAADIVVARTAMPGNSVGTLSSVNRKALLVHTVALGSCCIAQLRHTVLEMSHTLTSVGPRTVELVGACTAAPAAQILVTGAHTAELELACSAAVQVVACNARESKQLPVQLAPEKQYRHR